MVVAMSASSACGSVVDALAGRDRGPEVAKVVVLVPDGGPRQAAGEDVLAAVTTALADVDAGGWDVVVERVADGTTSADPSETSVEVAVDVADDLDVIAVVGGLTPEAVRAAQRPLNEHGIAFLSPADHQRANTRGPDPSAPQRPYTSYFRTAVPADEPLAVAAEYAVHGAGATTVVAVHDGQPGKAAELGRHVTSLGAQARLATIGEVAATISEADTAKGPVAFYLVGDTNAGDVADAAERAGLDPIVIGKKTLASGGAIESAEGGTFVAVVPGTLDVPADPAVPDLEGAGTFAAPAYDAGRALEQMLERCLPSVRGSARDARHGCLGELDTVSVSGATGHVTFDPYGDRPGAWPTLLVRRGNDWVEFAES